MQTTKNTRKHHVSYLLVVLFFPTDFRGNYRGFVLQKGQVLASQKSGICRFWPETPAPLTNTRNTASFTQERLWNVEPHKHRRYSRSLCVGFLNCLALVQIMNLFHLSLWGVLETYLSPTEAAGWCKCASQHPCQCVKVFSVFRR